MNVEINKWCPEEPLATGNRASKRWRSGTTARTSVSQPQRSQAKIPGVLDIEIWTVGGRERQGTHAGDGDAGSSSAHRFCAAFLRN